MSDAPDIRRPAARTRTAAYFILFSPRYVSFRDLLMAPRRVPVYTSPLPLTPFFGKPFVEIGAVRTRSTVPVQVLRDRMRNIRGNAPRNTQGMAAWYILTPP